MGELAFEVDWLDAPGVTDVVDAATWARLEIRLSRTGASPVVLTRLLDQRTQLVRSGTYGPVYGLARWLVDNYWFLFSEAPRTSRARSSREPGHIEGLRGWVRRHSLLAAREGASLPDVTLARDGDEVVLAAFADPDRPAVGHRPVTFLSTVVERIAVTQVHEGIAHFLDAVLERLRGVGHPDVTALRDDWTAVLTSRSHEADLCTWAARLGLDPYDADELPDELASYFTSHLPRLSAALRGDLLDSLTSSSTARTAVSWLEVEAPAVGPARAPRHVSSPPASISAHQLGYLRARELRKEVGLHRYDHEHVVSAVGAKYGFDLKREARSGTAFPVSAWDALVGADDTGLPTIVGPELGHESRVFRWARALHLWRFGSLGDGPRLLTRSHVWEQREARAFAAELLAPASALGSRLRGGQVDEQEIADLAAEFGVAPSVIQHQLENHALAVVA